MIRNICTICGSNNVREIADGNLVYFICDECFHKGGQAHQIDGKIIVEHTPKGIKHVTAGALIEREGNILLVKRRTFPYRFSHVAGHVEYGETPVQAVKREVFEEVGMNIYEQKLVFHGDIVGNRCRAGSNLHEWYFFRAKCNGDPVVNDEHEYAVWLPPEKLIKLDLGHATRFLLEQLNIIPRLNYDE